MVPYEMYGQRIACRVMKQTLLRLPTAKGLIQKALGKIRHHEQYRIS